VAAFPVRAPAATWDAAHLGRVGMRTVELVARPIPRHQLNSFRRAGPGTTKPPRARDALHRTMVDHTRHASPRESEPGPSQHTPCVNLPVLADRAPQNAASLAAPVS